MKEHSDAYTFYNRGKIEVKGLGLKQTYFVEPPPEDGNCATDLRISQSGSSFLVTNGQKDDAFNRNPSFVKFSRCTIVNPPNSSQPPQPTCTLNRTPSPVEIPEARDQGLLMVKPPVTISIEDEARINQIVPIQTPKLETETQISLPDTMNSSRTTSADTSTEKSEKRNGDTGSHASMFISANNHSNNGSLDSTLEATNSHKNNSKQKSKCTVS